MARISDGSSYALLGHQDQHNYETYSRHHDHNTEHNSDHDHDQSPQPTQQPNLPPGGDRTRDALNVEHSIPSHDVCIQISDHESGTLATKRADPECDEQERAVVIAYAFTFFLSTIWGVIKYLNSKSGDHGDSLALSVMLMQILIFASGVVTMTVLPSLPSRYVVEHRLHEQTSIEDFEHLYAKAKVFILFWTWVSSMIATLGLMAAF